MGSLGKTFGAYHFPSARENRYISDLVFLAYHAMKREAAGKPVKPIEAWTETISEVIVGEANPKATQSEASAE